MKISWLCSKSLLLVIILSDISIASECDNWQIQHSEWLWCDDFEDSSPLTNRYEDVSTNGMNRSLDDSNQGQASLKQSYSTNQTNAGWVIKVNDGGFPDHMFYRVYHKFSAGYTVFPPKLSRIGHRQRGTTWKEIFRVHTWLKNNGEVTLDVLAENSTQANSGGYLPLRNSGYTLANHADEWVAIEVEVQLNTPGMSDGLYRLWIDDNLLVEALNIDLRGNTNDKINEVMLDTYWNAGATSPLDRYYDNFVISTSKIGLINTVGTPTPMPPIAMCVAPPQTPIIQNL